MSQSILVCWSVKMMRVLSFGILLASLFVARVGFAAPPDARALLLQSDWFHDEYRQDLKEANAYVQQFLNNGSADRSAALLAAARISRLQGAYAQATAYLEQAAKVPNQDFFARLRRVVEERLLQLERFSPLFGGYSAITADLRCTFPDLAFQSMRFNDAVGNLLGQYSDAGKSEAQKQREAAEVMHLLSMVQWAEASFSLREMAQHEFLSPELRATLRNAFPRAESTFLSQSAKSVQNGWLVQEQRQNLRQRLLWPIFLLLQEDKNGPSQLCSSPEGSVTTGDALTSLACAEAYSFPIGTADDLGVLVEAPAYAPVAAQRAQQRWRTRQPTIQDRLQLTRPIIAATKTRLGAAGSKRGLTRLLYLESAQKVAAAVEGQLPQNQLASLIPDLELVAAAASEVGDRRLVRQAVALGALARSLHSPTAAGVDWVDSLVKLSIQDGDYGQLLGWGRLYASVAAEQANTYFRPDVADVLYHLAVRFYLSAGAPIEGSKAMERWAEVLQATGATKRALGLLKQALSTVADTVKSCQAKGFPPGDLFSQQAFLLNDFGSIVSELNDTELFQANTQEIQAFSEGVVKTLAADPDLHSPSSPVLPKNLHLNMPLMNQAVSLLLSARQAVAQMGPLVDAARKESSQPGSGQAAAKKWEELFTKQQIVSHKVVALQMAAYGAYQSHAQRLRLKQLKYRDEIRNRDDAAGDTCNQDPRKVRRAVRIEQGKELSEQEAFFDAAEPYFPIILDVNGQKRDSDPNSVPALLYSDLLRNKASTEVRLLIEQKQYLLAKKKLARIEREQGANWHTSGTHSSWNRLELYSKLYAGLYQQNAATTADVLTATRRMIEVFDGRRIATRDERMRTRFSDLPEGQLLYATAVNSASIVRSAEETLDYIERAKARSLQERLVFEDSPLLSRSLDLGKALNLIEDRLEANGCATTPSEPQCQAWQARANELLSEYEEQRRMSRLLASVAPTSLEKIVAAMPAQSALFDYFVTGDSVVGVLLAKGGDKWVFRRQISTTYLEQVVRRVRDRLALGDEPASCDLAWLSQLLLPDRAQMTVLKRAGVTLLFLVPHGPLHDVPFAALPVEGTRLIEQFVLRQLPYAGLIRREASDSAPKSQPAVLYYDGDAEDAARSANARPEALAIAKLYGLSDAKNVKTRADFLSALRDHDGVYFVGHAVAGDNEGRFSRIDLPRVSPTDNGDLSVVDVLTNSQAFRARWVLLSACETARGVRASGDEGVGIARALLQGGVRNVLANLVRVNAAADPRFRNDLHRELKAGTDPAMALAKAQRTAYHNHLPTAQWASMVAIGAAP